MSTTLATIQAMAARLADVERVTRFPVRDVALPAPAGQPSPGTMALITMDNGFDHTKPTTLGFGGLLNLEDALDVVRRRAAAGEIVAVGITGKPFIFAAGADLTLIAQVTEREQALALARFGHEVMGRLHALGVPSFAFVNGLALGGGLEIVLGCDYRTMRTGAMVGLPETMLGLVPGWGGCYRLPRLIGPAKAVEVIVANPLQNNRLLTADAALRLGVTDAVFDGTDYLVRSLRWASDVVAGRVEVKRADHTRDPAWGPTVEGARALLRARTGGLAPAPERALDLVAQAAGRDETEGFAAEDEALGDLIMGEEFRAAIYAFNLVQRRARKPVGAPDGDLARPVTKVGVVGAGLMASQLALLFARRLEVPVVMTDIDADRLGRGLGYVRTELDRQVAKGRLGTDTANRIRGQVTGSVDPQAFADVDFVIEAVFEDLTVKRQVFSDLEQVVCAECVLATNTSSLSVTEMAADLRHPERVVGFHFFNPVAVMPLVEVVRGERTDEAARATAFAVARTLRKTVIGVDDAPSFVVNRLLGRFMAEIGTIVDEGTPIEAADAAVVDLAPKPPFQLIGMVGPAIALHNNESLQRALGDRFAVPRVMRAVVEAGRPGYYLPGTPPVVDPEVTALLQPGDSPSPPQQVRRRVLEALADEARRMLDEQVVADPGDIDLGMLTGAGFSFWNGGLLPLLDRSGVAEQVTGRRFLAPGVASVPT